MSYLVRNSIPYKNGLFKHNNCFGYIVTKSQNFKSKLVIINLQIR